MRTIEVIIIEDKMSEMGKLEEGAVGWEGAIQAATAEIEPNDMACLVITTDTVPQTAIFRL